MDKSKLAVTLVVVILSVNLIWSFVGVFGVLGVLGTLVVCTVVRLNDMCAAFLCCSWIGAVSRENFDVLQVDASGNSMGTSAAKAFGDSLLKNKTIQHLNVSNNSFGKPMVDDQVKLKSSGDIKTVTNTFNGDIEVEGNSQWFKPSQFEFKSGVPAFCAGLATSTSLLSVSGRCTSLRCTLSGRWSVHMRHGQVRLQTGGYTSGCHFVCQSDLVVCGRVWCLGSARSRQCCVL